MKTKVVTVRKIVKLLNITEFVSDIHRDFTDEEVMAKYKLTAAQLEKTYSKLFYGGYLTQMDLERRVEMRDGKDCSHIPIAEICNVTRLYECVICGFISHLHFSKCPRCAQVNLRRLTKQFLDSSVSEKEQDAVYNCI